MDMLIDSASFDSLMDDPNLLDEAQWQHYVALKRFFTDFSLPAGYEPVYAAICSANGTQPLVKLKVVEQFPNQLAKAAYRIIHSQLGEHHPLLAYIENPEG